MVELPPHPLQSMLPSSCSSGCSWASDEKVDSCKKSIRSQNIPPTLIVGGPGGTSSLCFAIHFIFENTGTLIWVVHHVLKISPWPKSQWRAVRKFLMARPRVEGNIPELDPPPPGAVGVHVDALRLCGGEEEVTGGHALTSHYRPGRTSSRKSNCPVGISEV